MPHPKTQDIIADRFNISVAELTGEELPPVREQKEKADSQKGTNFEPTKEYWEKVVSKMSKEQMRIAMDILMKNYVEDGN